ncbi:BadF/BadG/BcrA/BcrD ATPase family protein [Thiofilum flexile]|uniref:BadF/BadG/BcrA/BcrD ATPase family protein n=1 Tax=Thiofilum flexile TaxID=125627 RepID=UPI0003A866B0|nr:BadF/BadG/BcrA/BcrD ATPase family protein [Thiofilum flexile]
MAYQPSTTYYVGIDGGGSNCRARLTDHTGTVLGEGVSGSANLRLGVEHSIDAIRHCVSEALKQAGLSQLSTTDLKAGIGLAGLVLKTDIVTAAPIKALFAACQLTNDAYIACLGAHQGQAGGIVILGTGSCAQIICPEASRTFGGWGLTLADQASGSWLGREAMRMTLLAVEQIIPASPLTDYLGQPFGQDAEALFNWSLDAKPAHYAQLAPQVFQFAQNQDPYAQILLQNACQDLIRMIRVLERYQTGHIALLGGLANLYQSYLPAEIQALLTQPKGSALEGALLMAQDL